MAGVTPSGGGNRRPNPLAGKIGKPDIPAQNLQVSVGGGSTTPDGGGNRRPNPLAGKVPAPNIPTPGLQVQG